MRRILLGAATLAACAALSTRAFADELGSFGSGTSYSSSGVSYGTAYADTYGTVAYRTAASESMLYGHSHDDLAPLDRPRPRSVDLFAPQPAPLVRAVPTSYVTYRRVDGPC